MPHVCGDEPAGKLTIISEKLVCPTYVGMNRVIEKFDTLKAAYAPRMWG